MAAKKPAARAAKKAAPKKTAPKPAAPKAGLVLGVQDVYYNVENMARAVAFYHEVLGLPVLYSDDYWTSLDIAGVRFGLHGTGGAPVPQVPRDDHGAHAGATLTLRVADIDKGAAHLKKHGVKLLGEIARDPWGSTVAFVDTEGNVLKLMQPPAK